jgi:hypothetical protein
MDRNDIGTMIAGLLRERRSYVFVPKRLTEYIVAAIERPEQTNTNYRTGSLIEYLHERRLKMVVSNELWGDEVVVDSNRVVHEVIRRGMSFYGLSESALVNEGINYHLPKSPDASVNIDRFIELMERFNYKIVIER